MSVVSFYHIRGGLPDSGGHLRRHATHLRGAGRADAERGGPGAVVCPDREETGVEGGHGGLTGHSYAPISWNIAR